MFTNSFRRLSKIALLIQLHLAIDDTSYANSAVQPIGRSFQKGRNDISEIFKRHEFIPAVITIPPKEFVNITYSKMNDSVITSDIAFRDEVEDAPEVWWKCNESLYYTLSVLDMDNTKEPKRSKPKPNEDAAWWRERQWHIWLVVNIPGYNITAGDTLFEYALGTEWNKLSMHIMIFLVYQQPNVTRMKFDVGHRDPYDDRMKFEIEQFANRYNFGSPIAGNFLYFA